MSWLRTPEAPVADNSLDMLALKKKKLALLMGY